MPRTAITPIQIPAGSSRTPLAVTYTAGDAANGNSVPLTGTETVLFKNTHAANGITVTVTAPTDSLGNATNITTFAIAALAEYVMPQPRIDVWRQSDGNLWVDWAGTGTPTIAVLRQP